MLRRWLPTAIFLTCLFASLGMARSQGDGNEPLRVFEAADRTVVVDAATRSISFDGQRLSEASGVVGAVDMRGHLFVAQRNATVLIYELPEPATDGVPRLVQRVEQLGRELVDIVLVPEAQRVLVLAAGSTEIFGLRLFEEELIGGGEVDEPAYTGHARFMEFLRAGDGSVHPPRLFAAGPNSLALVTDKEVIELFHLDRSYRVLGRSPIPQGVARIDAMVHAGSRWIASGLNEKAEPVVLWAEELAGAWRDMDVDAIDAALEVDGERIAWLPGRFSVTDEHVAMAVRGERGAVVRWPVESVALEADAIEVTWLTPTGHAPRK